MAVEVATSDARGRMSELRRSWRTIVTRRFSVVVFLLAVECAFFGMTQDSFLTSQNIENILTSVAILWVVSMGLTFVMLIGGFDLSLGAILQLTGIFIGAVLLDMSLPGGVAFVLALVFGAALGGSSTDSSSASSACRSSW